MKYIVKVYTDWVGEENYYKIESQNYREVEDAAYSAARDNFNSFGGEKQVAEDMGFDIINMSEEDWVEVYEEIDNNEPFGAVIETYDEKIHGNWDDFDNLI